MGLKPRASGTALQYNQDRHVDLQWWVRLPVVGRALLKGG